LTSLPSTITNLQELSNLYVNTNALEISDPKVIQFLDSKQSDWQTTQTVSPKHFTITKITNNSISLSWEPIEYTKNRGGYEIYYSKSSADNYIIYDITENKTTGQMIISDLTANTTYFFKVRSVTFPHTYSSENSRDRNKNTVHSIFTKDISAKTLRDVDIETSHEFLFAQSSILMPLTITVNMANVNIQDVSITTTKGTFINQSFDQLSNTFFCQIMPGTDVGTDVITVSHNNVTIGTKSIETIQRQINHFSLNSKKVIQEKNLMGEPILLRTLDANGFPMTATNTIDIMVESTPTNSVFSIRPEFTWYDYTSQMIVTLPPGETTAKFMFRASDPGNYTIYARELFGQDILGASLNIQVVDRPIAELRNEPSSITNAKNYTLIVQGEYVTAYQYQFDQNTWSPEKSIDEPIILTNVNDGPHTLSLIGKNAANTWQDKSLATTISWTIKTQINPPKDLFLPSEFDTGTLNNDQLTCLSNLSIMGTCEKNATIQIYGNDQLLSSAEIIVNDNSFTATIVLQKGINAISATQIDLAGNISQPSEKMLITVDQTPPELFVYPKGGDYTAGQSISLHSSDTTASIYYLSHGVMDQYRLYTTPVKINSNTQLSFYAEDAAGNKSVIQTEIYTLQKEANHYDIRLIPDTAARQIMHNGATIKYDIEIIAKNSFKGRMSLFCNGLSENDFAYCFYQDGQKIGTIVTDIQTIPCALTLELTALRADLKRHQFNLESLNYWEDGSAPMKTVELYVKVISRGQSGIHLECETDYINKGDSSLIYGAILPPLENKTVTLSIVDEDLELKTKTLVTEIGGKFYDDTLLSSLNMGFYTLKASWIDEASNHQESDPITIFVDREQSSLTLLRKGSDIIEMDETITLLGQITPELPYQSIELAIISPESDHYTQTLITDETGHFQITDSFCDTKGIWRFNASWKGNSQIMHCESNELPILVGIPGKVLILGAGMKNDQNRYWETTKNLTTLIYEYFKDSGFTDDLIYLMINSQMIDINHDEIPDPVVDNNEPAKDDFLDVLNSEFTNDLNQETPLFIYMIGHGTEGAQFQVFDYENFLAAKDFSDALDTLQGNKKCSVIIILESCFSGTFMSALANPDYSRVVLTSAGNEEYRTDETGLISFSFFLFESLADGDHLLDAYDNACDSLHKYEHPTPLFDDNGDGIHDDKDGKLSSTIYLPEQSWGLDPCIDHMDLTYVLNNETATQVFVNVKKGQSAIQKVWTQIIPPGIKRSGHESITLKELEYTYNAGLDHYSATLDKLYHNGIYTLSTYAMDNHYNISVPYVSYINVSNNIQRDINNDGLIGLKDLILGLQLLCQIPVDMGDYSMDIKNQVGMKNVLWMMNELGE
jgi:hypothetical protein